MFVCFFFSPWYLFLVLDKYKFWPWRLENWPIMRKDKPSAQHRENNNVANILHLEHRSAVLRFHPFYCLFWKAGLRIPPKSCPVWRLFSRLTTRGTICWCQRRPPSTSRPSLPPTSPSATRPRPPTSWPSRWDLPHTGFDLLMTMNAFDFTLTVCLSAAQVGDIVSVIDMPPKEDTGWWRGKHGFQVNHCSTLSKVDFWKNKKVE